MKEIFISNKKTLILSMCILLTLFFVLSIVKNDNTGILKVNYLDVGQGDAALIITPSNHRILIDTGPSIKVFDSLSRMMPSFDKSFDHVILTHPDLDHVGNINTLSKNYNLKNVFISKIGNYESVIGKDLQASSVITKISDKQNLKYILSKNEDLIFENSIYSDKSDDNSKSIITSFTYQNYNFIFTGDIDEETERKYVTQHNFNNNSIKILKVAHHGSKTSSSEYFLKAVKPDYCILSYGVDNKYGHPNKEVVDKLEKYCKYVFRTAVSGDITFTIKEGVLQIGKTK